MAVIAIDLGGTELAGAVFSSTGRISGKRSVDLNGRQGQEVGKLICGEVQRLSEVGRVKRLQIEAISVSVPGISYSRTGTVWAPNIPGWKQYPLRAEIQSFLDPKDSRRVLPRNGRIAVVIDNDRACSILGETWRGAAMGCRNAIFLAVGTGIGAGILIDGRVLRGSHDIAGSIGWWALDRPFRPEYVACGCFEHHASGSGLAKVAAELRSSAAAPDGCSGAPEPSHSAPLTAREVFTACNRGDPTSKQVLAQAVEFWGMAVANLVSLLNPETVLFGGGVFGPATKFLNQICREARKWAQPIAMREVKLRASKLGGDAALYGAARRALEAEC